MPRTEGNESDEVNDEFEDIRVIVAPQYDLTSDSHASESLGGRSSIASSSIESARRQNNGGDRSDGESDDWSEWSGFSEAEGGAGAGARSYSRYSNNDDDKAISNLPENGILYPDGTVGPATTVQDL